MGRKFENIRGFIMLFFNKLIKKNDWKHTLVRDLVTLTAIDGDIHDEEVAFAFKIAVNDLGFTEQKFVDLMKNLGDVKDVYPENHQDKIDYIKYLLQLTYVDGYVDDNEVEYMKIIAQRMNLSTETIDKAIEHIESTYEDSSSYIEKSDNDFSDDSSSIKIVLTSPYNIIIEVQSKEGIRNYLFRLSKLTDSDLYIELSNVMAAKHNLVIVPSTLNEAGQKQEKVTDLTDKALLICIYKFGQDIVMDYDDGNNMRKFNELVNNIDEEVAYEELYPEQHGRMMLQKLSQVLT